MVTRQYRRAFLNETWSQSPIERSAFEIRGSGFSRE